MDGTQLKAAGIEKAIADAGMGIELFLQLLPMDFVPERDQINRTAAGWLYLDLSYVHSIRHNNWMLSPFRSFVLASIP